MSFKIVEKTVIDYVELTLPNGAELKLTISSDNELKAELINTGSFEFNSNKVSYSEAIYITADRKY